MPVILSEAKDLLFGHVSRGCLLFFLAACSTQHVDIDTQPEPVKNAAIAPAEAPVKAGDCVEARRRAAAKPDLDVDRIPSPVVANPPALRNLPASALRKDGSAEVK